MVFFSYIKSVTKSVTMLVVTVFVTLKKSIEGI